MKDQELGNYYRIAESGAELDGFNLTVTDTNAAVLLQNTTDTGFTFTNTYVDAGRALTLKKIVSAPDTTGSFTFTVSYTDAGGKPQTESITLKNGESTTITGIPKGVQVTVTETTTDGYTVIMKDPSTGTVLAGSSSYTFTMSDDTAMDIYNTSIVALPETGGIGRGIFLYAGIGLMLTAVITGCLLRRKYGKEGDLRFCFLSCPRKIYLYPRRRNYPFLSNYFKSERIRTMKTMRKLFTVLLALAMTLALAVSAFAADTGSITITNPQGDHTYTAYKIFDVTYTADGVNYSYTISDTDAAFSTVKAYADVAANGLNLTAVANTNKYNVSIGAGFSAASFAQYLKTNVGSLGTGTAFTKVGDTMKASDLALGYYFVSGTSGTVCELATAKDIQIRDKNEVPQIEKVVDDNDGTVEIGQVLTYTITGKVPSTKGYTEFTYQVTDTMTEGLTFNKDVKVTIGGVDVTAAATITNNENSFVASVNMMNYQDQIDAPVVITYTATVNEKAIQREKETNAATLKYSNNPADKTTFEESSVEVDVFSFNIVINKYAANNAETKLEGAKFVLKNNEGKYYKYDAATKAVTWVAAKADATEVSTDANGAARFDGLQAGTYSLEETVAPAGYNQLTKDITIVLDKNGSATIDGAASAPGAAHSLTTGVANSTGTVLPETGGTGTVIFVALGALAVICAGVFLVTNKRMSKESF